MVGYGNGIDAIIKFDIFQPNLLYKKLTDIHGFLSNYIDSAHNISGIFIRHHRPNFLNCRRAGGTRGNQKIKFFGIKYFKVMTHKTVESLGVA